MISNQFFCKKPSDLDQCLEAVKKTNPDLVLVVAGREWFEKCDLTKIYHKNPKACVIGCSTAGEISKEGVTDNTLVISTIQFKNPILKSGFVQFDTMSDSFKNGKTLAQQFDKERLSALFIIGKGLNINGTKVVEGLQSEFNKNTIISGGLAGDGANFGKTYVILNDQIMTDGVAAVGIYDKSVDIFTGSQGGWKPFGPVRKVTKSKDNILYTIDNKSALQVYKEYLGDQSSKLPGSGLLFPLEILDTEKQNIGTIRTILSIDETEGSITFAGEIGEGKFCRLMHTKNEGLIAGARSAAEDCLKKTQTNDDAFAVLISCVGRKLVMTDEIDDEIDVVKEVLNLKNNMIGFYSYGEISPQAQSGTSILCNQTMTITYFKDAI